VSDVQAGRFHFLTPTYRPAGGVVKVFDYLVHALDLGYAAEVHCPLPLGRREPLLQIPRFSGLRTDPRVHFHRDLTAGLGPEDWVLFSWPPHYEQIARGIGPDVAHERVIHIVQNTRHANPEFAGGYATRLLARPMARIMVAHEVTEACAPHLNPESATTTIVEAHDWPFFHRRRASGLPSRLRVGYTTWKSHVGIRVEELIADRHDRRLMFRSIRRVASWTEVRDLLHWCDVFLCCPGPQEGFYLPGLEALAAGAIVVTPDVGGNRAYARFGENCLLARYADAEDYVAILDELAQAPPELVDRLRATGYATLEDHTLDRERDEFAAFLVELASRTRIRALVQ
jgi:glycosyltransferase involved in cell wall biosynthesis